MKVKADQEQLRGLVTLLAFLLINNKPIKTKDKVFYPAEKILYATNMMVYNSVKKLFQKLRGKSESTCLGTYNFSLKEDEALPLYAFIQTVGMPSDEFKYESIKMQLILNAIDKEYV